MSKHRFPWLIFVLTAIACYSVNGFDDRGRGQRPASWLEDASINDVFFLNEDLGWAVGDLGLILKTTNGGLDWQATQNAGLDLDDERTLEDKISKMRPVQQVHELDPITCALRSVYFVDEQNGWIAGNFFTPLLGRGHSIILRTHDGGRTWNAVRFALLPEIYRIHFQHLLGGWALGGTNSIHRSGVMTTSSGGRRWASQEVEPAKTFIDGDLIPSGFVVVDNHQRLGKISGRQFKLSQVPGHCAAGISAVRMMDDQHGWAVGKAGRILRTSDAGKTWYQPDPLRDQRRMLRQFDFATLQVTEDRVFVAGDPGNLILSFNADDGGDLKKHATGIQVAVKKLHFVDNHRGWAAGDLGTIISTSDRGQNWRLQRGTHNRYSILGVSPGIDELPLAFLSRFSGDERYLSACFLTGVEAHLDKSLAHAALERVGCASLSWAESGHEVSKPERQLEQLVRCIRTRQPNVLVCSSVHSSHDSSTQEVVAMCRTAIELASNPDAYPDQIEVAELSAWQVDRLIVRMSHSGEFTLHGERFLPSFGILLQDQIAIARAMTGISPVYQSPEHYRVESFTGSITAVGDDIMYGLETIGRVLPRRKPGVKSGSLGALATSPLKREKLKEILELANDREQQHQVRSMIRGFGGGQDAREQGIWLWQLADALLQNGRNELAAFALNHLTNRFQHHPLTPAALVWLSSHYFSSEVDTATSEELKLSLANVDLTVKQPSKIETSIDENGVTQIKWQPNKNRNQQVTRAEFVDNAVEAVRENRIKKAEAYLNRLKQRDPDLALSEPIRFMEAKFAEKIPGRNAAEGIFKTIRRSADVSSPFRFASSRELKSREPIFRLALPVCFESTSRPLLDGILNDEIWQSALQNGHARMRVVTPANENLPTNTDICWLAYDDQFFYFATRCRIQNSHQCQPLTGTRTRDPDLQRFDRVRLELDFDRDLQSGFVFEVDSCGRAAENCAGSTGWNPKWYVASKRDGKTWTTECAIPWKELVADEIDPETLIAHRFSRLDGNSIDLWSGSVTRRTQNLDSGIVAGLRIEPKRYEFLRFAESPAESTTADKLR